jgi:hypothetical protein
VNLALRLEYDSHRHDRVNFSHPHVSHIIASSSVNIEEPNANQTEEDVEALEVPCGDGVWHIKRCPPYVTCSMLCVAKIHQTFLCFKDNYQINFYWCPCPNLLRVVVSIPWCTFKTAQVLVLCK